MTIAHRVTPLAESGHPVLILCRTGFARRWAVAELLRERSGWENVAVKTLSGLVREYTPESLTPPAAIDEPIPVGHPWAQSLADRPQLRRLLQTHAATAHRLRALNMPIAGLPAPITALVDAGWGVPSDIEGWRRVAGGQFTHVVPVGFFTDSAFGAAGTLGAAERAIVRALGLQGDLLEQASGPLPAIAVTDVAAEAREAVRLLFEAKAGLALVADAATGERLTSALQRNGVAVSGDGSVGLDRHSLTALLSGLIPVFESRGAEAITQAELCEVLLHPVLSRRAQKSDVAALASIGLDGQVRLSVRSVRKILAATRRFRATPLEWVDLLAAATAELMRPREMDDGRVEVSEARLQGIGIIAQGRAKLLAECASFGTFAAMADLVKGCGLADPSDRIGAAIRAELRRAGNTAVSSERFLDALGGAVDAGILPAGVTVLRYDQYDGRPSDVLVLLDVHHKGVGSAPAVDPLLGETGLRALGLPSPSEVVRERLQLLRFAATRAGSCTAIVAATDAGGRVVVAPIDLALHFDGMADGSAQQPRDSYGLQVDIPERKSRVSMMEGSHSSPDAGLALQIDAEWFRAGVLLAGSKLPRVPQSPATLEDYLTCSDLRPPDLRAFLGDVGTARGSVDGLPSDFRLSASKLIHFTSCLYQAWGATVVGLGRMQNIEEDLGASEIGTAAHKVLELQSGLHWVVPDSGVSDARRLLVERSTARMEAEVEAVRTDQKAHEETGAVAAARVGLTTRWKRHWTRYAARRITAASDARAKEMTRFAKTLDKETVEQAAGALFPTLAKGPRDGLGKVMVKVLVHTPTADALRDAVETLCKDLANKNQPAVRVALAGPFPPEMETLIAMAAAAWVPPPDALGDALVVGVEAKFDAESPTALSLGARPVRVKGSIDALVRWRRGGTGSIEIVDFKTGKAGSGGDKRDVLGTLTKPQLPFYGLVVRAGLIPVTDGAPVRALSYDMVSLNKDTRMEIEDEALDRASFTFGALLDRARAGDFPLAPHPASCPLVGGKGYCDLRDACRLRALPTPPESDVATGDDQESQP